MTQPEIISELQTRRFMLGLDQQSLSIKAGLHKNQVGRIENQHNNPTLKTLLAICDALNLSLVLEPKQ
jgi:transcriptional regulator with XRE-family HTH domain